MKKYTEEYIKRAAKAPLYPNYTYRNKEWKNWAKFLNKKHIYYSYKIAIEKLQKFNINTITTYREAHKEGKLSKKFPLTPNSVYKNEWEGWPKFLKKEFVSLNVFKKQIISLGVVSGVNYNELRKTNKIPKNLTSSPHTYYKDWSSWNQVLGNNYKRKKHKKKFFITYIQCHKKVKKLKFKNRFEYLKKRDKSMPSDPAHIYKETGWNGWNEFLGKNK